MNYRMYFLIILSYYSLNQHHTSTKPRRITITEAKNFIFNKAEHENISSNIIHNPSKKKFHIPPHIFHRDYEIEEFDQNLQKDRLQLDFDLSNNDDLNLSMYLFMIYDTKTGHDEVTEENKSVKTPDQLINKSELKLLIAESESIDDTDRFGLMDYLLRAMKDHSFELWTLQLFQKYTTLFYLEKIDPNDENNYPHITRPQTKADVDRMRSEQQVDRTPRWVSITDEVESQSQAGRTQQDQFGKPLKNQVQKRYKKDQDTITKEQDLKRENQKVKKRKVKKRKSSDQ